MAPERYSCAAPAAGPRSGTGSGAAAACWSSGRLGDKRRAGSGEGLTKAAAERELRRLIDAVKVPPVTMDIAEAGRRWLAHLEAIGRRRSTLMDYESAVRAHLILFFGKRPIAKITPDGVERFMAAKRGYSSG
jgi:hypothetical protein